MLRTQLAPEWIKSEHVEMHGLWRRGALEKVLRSSLDASAHIFGSRFHYKIKRHLDMSLDKIKVRLVLQGQHKALIDASSAPDGITAHELDARAKGVLKVCDQFTSVSALKDFIRSCLRAEAIKSVAARVDKICFAHGQANNF